jgi:hypothetical protein
MTDPTLARRQIRERRSRTRENRPGTVSPREEILPCGSQEDRVTSEAGTGDGSCGTGLGRKDLGEKRGNRKESVRGTRNVL